jgi:hypothetical protein
MTQVLEVKPIKKTRTRRSPEMIAELIWEAERKGNAAEVCRRESIAPNRKSLQTFLVKYSFMSHGKRISFGALTGPTFA